MNRNLTTREKFMISFLALLMLVMAYYQVIYKPVNNEMSNIEKTKLDVESSMVVESAKNNSLKNMKAQLAALAKTPNLMLTAIPLYDNTQNVITELAFILSAATDYDLNFSQVKTEGTLVRRTVGINFTCTGYDKASIIMKQLAASRYRCRITDYSITAKPSKTAANTTTVQALDITKDTLQVSLIVVFYEFKTK